MAWVRLDDQARQHPKLLMVGPTAAWLWVCGLMWANTQKAHDGVIPTIAVPVLYPVPTWKREAARLVEAGLWEPIEGGYRIHDYHEYQLSAETAADLSEKRKAAGRLGGQRSGDARRRSKTASEDVASATANAKQTGSNLLPVCLPLASEATNPVPIPIPIPIPLQETPNLTVRAPSPSEARASRTKRRVKSPFPRDFKVSADIDRMCRSEGLPSPYDVLPDFESKALANDYRYADWEAAFRNWMRSPITRRDYPAWEPPEEPSPPVDHGPPATAAEVAAIMGDLSLPWAKPLEASLLAEARAADVGADVRWTRKAGAK